MKLTDAGLKIIKDSEGLVLHVYADPGTKDRPYTAGYGHAGPDVQGMALGTKITLAQATAWLLKDLAATEQAVEEFLTGVAINDNQFSALVSFAYNIGSWRKTSLFSCVKSGDFVTAAKLFPAFDRASGRELPGLAKRRLAEQALFSS